MSAAGNNIDGGLCLVSDAPQVRQLLMLLLLLLLLLLLPASPAAAIAVLWLRMYSVSPFHSSTAQGLGTLQCRVWGAGELAAKPFASLRITRHLACISTRTHDSQLLTRA